MADYYNKWANNEWAKGGKWANAAEYIGGKYMNKWQERISRWSQPLQLIEIGENSEFWIDSTNDLLSSNTGYYDIATGALLSAHEGTNAAIGINSLTHDTLLADNELTIFNALQLGGLSLGPRDRFELISAVLYAEGGLSGALSEYLAIGSTIRNRSENPISGQTDGFSMVDIIRWKKSRIDGYHSRSASRGFNRFYLSARKREIDNIGYYSIIRHHVATRAVMILSTSSYDYSNRAFFWSSASNTYFSSRSDIFEFIKQEPDEGTSYSKFYKIKEDAKGVRKPW